MAQQEKTHDRWTDGRIYGPMLNAIQDMWAEHDEAAQTSCGCSACKTSQAFFLAAVECGESKR